MLKRTQKGTTAYLIVLLVVVLSAFILLEHPYAEGSEDGSTFAVQGNMSYQQGHYEEAVSQYKEAIAAGLNNGHIYYNLGNALYRTGRFGAAIANYRRALDQLPGDPDIVANLSLARRHAADKIVSTTEISMLGPSRILALYSFLNRYQMTLIFLLGYLLFWVCFLVSPFWRHPVIRSVQLFSLVFTILWAILLFGARQSRDGSYQFAFTERSRAIRPAVITVDEAKVYSGDSENYQVVFVLHDGAEIETGEERKSWVEIILPEGRRGWVKKDLIDII